jgi:hypothetical protein
MSGGCFNFPNLPRAGKKFHQIQKISGRMTLAPLCLPSDPTTSVRKGKGAAAMHLAHVLLLWAAVAASSPALAQHTVRVLTPSSDVCRSFTAAMDASDTAPLLALSGWALGFLSGVAQGTGIDFLRDQDGSKLLVRLYSECSKQPNKLLSFAVEEMANALVAGQQRR